MCGSNKKLKVKQTKRKKKVRQGMKKGTPK